MNGHANLYVKWGHKIDYKLCTKYLIDTKHETRNKYMIRYFEIEPNIYIYIYIYMLIAKSIYHIYCYQISHINVGLIIFLDTWHMICLVWFMVLNATFNNI